ncbi:DUF2726 domain-containing protein [Citrobacter meridianamericanus]|uniref:DUF2726 domain-containing protein n=1 Tax=Citrobacter meridianamericanus TaxID=2894201 RepID=UPI00351CE84B
MNLLLLSGAMLCILFLTMLYRKAGVPPGNRTHRLLQKRTCYQAKPFLTDRERRFYGDLASGLSGTSLQVMAQVRLADVVQTAGGLNRADALSLFRQISQWHCDFVVIDARTFAVKAIVELDDRTHLRPERQRRDELFNMIVAQAGIPLLRPRSLKAASEVAEVIRRLV